MEMEANTFLHLLSLHKTRTEAHLASLHHPTFHRNYHYHQHSILPCHQPQITNHSLTDHNDHQHICSLHTPINNLRDHAIIASLLQLLRLSLPCTPVQNKFGCVKKYILCKFNQDLFFVIYASNRCAEI